MDFSNNEKIEQKNVNKNIKAQKAYICLKKLELIKNLNIFYFEFHFLA